MDEIEVGDLLETEVYFGSDSIDIFNKGNRVCFVVLEKVEKWNDFLMEQEKWFYAKPQFALNLKGAEVLKRAEITGYPHTRTGYWLLKNLDCKKISGL